MRNKEIKILFKGDRAYLTSRNSLSFTQLGLPSVPSSHNSLSYWIIRILNYEVDQHILNCEILSYNLGESDFTPFQKEISGLLETVLEVRFKEIDTVNAIRTLKSGVAFPHELQTYYATSQKKIIIEETFDIHINKVRFRTGGVTIEKKFRDCLITFSLKIDNPCIKQEFDAVKDYFANVLKTKKIHVTTYIEIIDKKVNIQTADSPEIKKINEQFIENVKLEFVKSIKKESAREKNVSLLTLESFSEKFVKNKSKTNPFHKNETELLNDLLKITNTKHYQHLRYLSDQHCHQHVKLKFFHKPFSFVFLIEGKYSYYLIWETLDTAEATYVWNIGKDAGILESKLTLLEKIIKEIKEEGKIAYILSKQDNFSRIYHDYSAVNDGFVKWQIELDSIVNKVD